MGVNASHTALPIGPQANSAEVAEIILARLREQFYRHPSPGFHARLTVIYALIGTYTLMSAAHLAALYWDRSHEFWCFRLVKRSTGIYIVPNYKVMCSISSLCMGLISLFYTRDLFRVYILEDTQANTSGWRGFIFVPLIVNGWLTSCAICIALMLTTEHESESHIPSWMRKFVPCGSGKLCLSGRSTNILFIGGGLFLLAMGCAAAVPFVIAGDDLWRTYTTLTARLEPLVATGRNLDPALTYSLVDDYEAILGKWNTYFDLAIVAFSVISVLPAVVVVINFSSLLLARILQRRIDSKMAFDGDLDAITTRRSELMERHEHQVETKGQLEQQATYVSEGLHKHAIAQVESLKRAKNDLTLTAAAVFCVTLAMTGLCIAIAVAAASGALLEGHWWLWEAVLTIPMWSYAVVSNVILACLLLNAFKHRSREGFLPSRDRSFTERRPSIAILEQVADNEALDLRSMILAEQGLSAGGPSGRSLG